MTRQFWRLLHRYADLGMVLHTARVFDLPFKIFVSLMGLTVATSTLTGVVVWWKKRCARRRFAERNFLIERAAIQQADSGV